MIKYVLIAMIGECNTITISFPGTSTPTKSQVKNQAVNQSIDHYAQVTTISFSDTYTPPKSQIEKDQAVNQSIITRPGLPVIVAMPDERPQHYKNTMREDTKHFSAKSRAKVILYQYQQYSILYLL